MQFKQYPSYKPSGVEWLGDVPEHWDSCNLKFISKIYAGGTPDRNRLDYWVKGEIPWINSGAVNQVIIKEPSEYITELGLKNSSAKYIPVNSLVMALAGQGKTKGMVAYTSIETTCNQSMAAIVPKNYHYKFLYYWLDSNYQNIRNLTGGDNRDGLNLAVLSNIPCPKISIVEQTQIVSFLNTETTRIDNLIAKQEKLIELLEEQRKSIISHAVTKGLNPNAPMKDSGVEWLGDVPESWEVIPSKFYFTERKEKAVNGDKQLTASQKHGIIYQDEFIAENGRVMVVMKNPEILKKVRPNDFVISMRSFQGGLELSSLEGSISSAYVMLKPDLSLINTEYFKYLFKTPRYIQSLQSTSNLIRDGQALRFNNFSQVKLVLPPKSEQQEIVEYLDKEKNKIDNLIYKQKTLIEKLKEYRASIISHAVTGKIDVREFDA